MRRDNRGRLIGETRTKTSADPDEVEYDIEYEYDQLGNRTARYDHMAEKRTAYTYDTDLDPNTMAYPTKNNRLVEPGRACSPHVGWAVPTIFRDAQTIDQWD